MSFGDMKFINVSRCVLWSYPYIISVIPLPLYGFIAKFWLFKPFAFDWLETRTSKSYLAQFFFLLKSKIKKNITSRILMM